ncbi:MAG: sigma-70 family RNA polymerase sigma factor [bacterium]|nr:sigma-70 family RNA polymerase sigma factor [bacterium]
MNWTPIDESRLIRRILKGDEAAFETFYKGHVHRLFRFAAARLGGDADWAEDVVQRTMCIAIKKLHTFRGEAAVYTWLCTICRREISADLSRLDRQPRKVALTEDEPEIRSALESLSVVDDPESHAQRREIARKVHVALDHLPTHYGNALEWKYILGLSVAEIADRLATKPKAAESLLTRARVAFREAYATLSSTDEMSLVAAPIDRGVQS